MSEQDWESRLAGIAIPAEVVDVSTLSLLELSTRLGAVRRRLGEIGQPVRSTTDEGRELHSLRSALIIEINKR